MVAIEGVVTGWAPGAAAAHRSTKGARGPAPKGPKPEKPEKREHRLDKVHMPRGVHTMSNRIIAPVTFGVRSVAKEDAGDGSWCELMWRGGRGARITNTPRDAETITGWWCTEEKVVRGVVPPRTTRTEDRKSVV